MKSPTITVNLSKVMSGVAFSLLWARLMYTIWPQPPFLTFVWFYLFAGSIVLKWLLFWAIDRVYLRKRLRDMARELEASDRRLREMARHGE